MDNAEGDGIILLPNNEESDDYNYKQRHWIFDIPKQYGLLNSKKKFNWKSYI